MVRTLSQKATWEQALGLAIALHNKGMSSNEVVPFLKERKYINAGIHYQAVTVSAIVAGMEIVERNTTPAVPSVDTAIELVNTGIDTGALHYTKGKRVHHVVT